VSVRDADFEIALRLLELLPDRGFLRFRESDAVLRKQHVEVSLGHAQDEILGGERKLSVGLLHLREGLLVCDGVLAAVDRLGDREAYARRSEIGARARNRLVAKARAAVGALGGSRKRGERQQARTALGNPLLRRRPRCARAAIRRIGALRLAKNIDEICGCGRSAR
jgi:hypothetical protein